MARRKGTTSRVYTVDMNNALLDPNNKIADLSAQWGIPVGVLSQRRSALRNGSIGGRRDLHTPKDKAPRNAALGRARFARPAWFDEEDLTLMTHGQV